jgi:hypothetical protein
MDTDKDMAAPTAAPPDGGAEKPAGPPDARVRWRRETLIPSIAVAVVAVTAVITSVVVSRTNLPAPELAGGSVGQQSVVQAPPLKPAPATAAKARTQDSENRNVANAMGASLACRNCGVVQMVVAVHGYGQPKPSGYQMHIRMDDGSTRTVEQRGALAAGSRVVVEGTSVRPLAAPLPGQG